MAKIKVVGDVAVVTSAIKKTTLEAIAKFKPKGLQLVDKESKEVNFAIGLGTTPSLGKFGATFTSVDADGFAQATLALPIMDNAAKVEYVKDNYGYALLTLNVLEGFIKEQATVMAEEFEAIEDGIELV